MANPLRPTSPPSADGIRIVLSYRSSCSSYQTTIRIYEKLAQRYGHDAVFFATASMEDDDVLFPKQLRNAIYSATYFVAVIGPDWLTKETGMPSYWVGKELEGAYQRYKDLEAAGSTDEFKIVSVSINRSNIAWTPDLLAIPSVNHLALRHHTTKIDPDLELTGIEKLYAKLDEKVPPAAPPARSPSWRAVGLAGSLLLVLAVAVGVWLTSLGKKEQPVATDGSPAKEDAPKRQEPGPPPPKAEEAPLPDEKHQVTTCEVVLAEGVSGKPVANQVVDVALHLSKGNKSVRVVTGSGTRWELTERGTSTRYFIVYDAKDAAPAALGFGTGDATGLLVDGAATSSKTYSSEKGSMPVFRFDVE